MLLSTFRHKWKTDKKAAKKLMTKFDENVVGQVLHGILLHLFDAGIKYELSTKAEELFRK